ncbi:MAG: serine hydrolase domain-containing protein [Aliishimia sp.]
MGFDEDRLTRITEWMQSYVDRRRFAGCSTLILRGGDEVYFDAVGLRNIDDNLPFERDTLARIYSMTKPITSSVLMMLVERGLFHLDAPVSEFIPAFNDMRALIPDATSIEQTEPCATPTLHQLLTHTSGTSYPFNPGPLGEEMDAQGIIFRGDHATLEEVSNQTAALPLSFHPGERWEYSVGIDIIGRVIEVATGRPLDEVFRTEVFEPLGMTETAFQVPSGIGDRFASLYTPLAGNSFDLNSAKTGTETLRCVDTWQESPYNSTSCFSGGGGLVGTIDDYAKFAEMLRRGGELNGNRLLSPKTVEFMTANHLPGDIASMGPKSFAELPMDGMGFGIGGAMVLNSALARAPGSLGDFGWGGMASTYFWIDPVLDLTAVFFTQLSPSSSYPGRPQLKALVHGACIT